MLYLAAGGISLKTSRTRSLVLEDAQRAGRVACDLDLFVDRKNVLDRLRRMKPLSKPTKDRRWNSADIAQKQFSMTCWNLSPTKDICRLLDVPAVWISAIWHQLAEDGNGAYGLIN